jgi:hypothetical protein
MTTTDIDFVQLQKDGGFTTPQMDLISKYAAFCNVLCCVLQLFMLRFAAFQVPQRTFGIPRPESVPQTPGKGGQHDPGRGRKVPAHVPRCYPA